MKHYSDSHEWILVDNGVGTVGITAYARQQLGDIVFIELPKIGSLVQAGGVVCVLESTKSATDIYSPVSGTILSINLKLKDQPHLINAAPENAENKGGWLYRIALSHPSETQALLSDESYHSIFIKQ